MEAAAAAAAAKGGMVLLGTAMRVITYYYKLLSGARRELDDLKEDIELLSATMDGAYNNHYAYNKKKSNLFKLHERRIKDLATDVEDTIATCVTMAAVDKTNRNFLRWMCIRQQVTFAEEVRSLTLKVRLAIQNAEEVANESVDATLESGSSSNWNPREDKLVPNLRKDKLVPLEEEKISLIRDLTRASENLEIISIVGMAGLGKTTLAASVYHDETITKEFPTAVWVKVSQDFNKREVLTTILLAFEKKVNPGKSFLELLNSEMVHGKTTEELSTMVREDHLEKAKFVIFMDDVWGGAWSKIYEFLPQFNTKGSKVLITTRDNEIAIEASRKKNLIYNLRLLDPEESWTLLRLQVFDELDELAAYPIQLEINGRLIVESCGGLPLAIIIIGKVLFDKLKQAENIVQAINEWKIISSSVNAYMTTKDADGKKMSFLHKIILLSYNHLSPELQDCFLYLGVFPEDAEIPVLKLSQLWIAEGFIHPEVGKSLEDIARGYWNDLINKNLLIVDKRKHDGEIKSCRIHDMIREFCKNEAASEKNFFQEIKRSQNGGFEPPPPDIKRCPRVSIHSFVKEFLSQKPPIEKTRSFLCSSKKPIKIEDKKGIPSILDAFKLVRILDVNNTIMFPEFPVKLTQLILLKYVTISGNEFKVLPKSINRMWNVETLELITSAPTLRIKANIWKMMQLRHLKTKASIVLENNGKGEGGHSLRTLSKLSPKSCTSKVFEKAQNLKTLGIRGELVKPLQSKYLKNLEDLEKLKLVNDVEPGPKAPEIPFDGLPDTFPLKLKSLTLSGTYLDWQQHMSILRKLDFLEELKLKNNAFTGESWVVGSDGFKSLELLYIAGADLKDWEPLDEAFPKLTTLVLRDCMKLNRVPAKIGEKIARLHMERVKVSAIDSAREIKEGRHAKNQRWFTLVIVSQPDDFLPTSNS